MANFIPNYSSSCSSNSKTNDEVIPNAAAMLLFAPKVEQYDGSLIKMPYRTRDMPG